MRFSLLLAVGLLLLASPSRATESRSAGRKHEVKQGDTLSEIAAEHHVSVDEIRRWNALEDDVIKVGQALTVNVPGQAYTIKSGDTLSQIAKRAGVDVAEIMTLNPGLKPNRIRAGQSLMLPPPKIAPARGKLPLSGPAEVVQLQKHPAYRLRNRHLAWATALTSDALVRGFTLLERRHGIAPRARVLDASRREGGPLGGHRSHRNGRDVDITYFQKRCGPAGCPVEVVKPEALDVPRQWALLRYWLEEGDVEMIFIDWSLQRELYEHAKAQGISEKKLDDWFQYPRPANQPHGVIRHWEGHRNHVHVRFVAPECPDGCCKPGGAEEPPVETIAKPLDHEPKRRRRVSKRTASARRGG